jgi:sulfur carrier protein ThiS
MKKTVTTKQLEVPVGALMEVADLLIENEITHQMVATDEDNDTITIEVEYDRDDRDTIHEVEDAIDDYEGDEEEEDADREEEDDNSQ